MQTIDDLIEELATKRLSPSRLASETGISVWRIYKWRDKKGLPKGPDSKTLEAWLGKKMDKVPITEIKKPGWEPDYKEKYFFLLGVLQDLISGAISLNAAREKIEADPVKPVVKSKRPTSGSKLDRKDVYISKKKKNTGNG